MSIARMVALAMLAVAPQAAAQAPGTADSRPDGPSPDAQAAAPTDLPIPVSIERIRTLLARPEPMRLPDLSQMACFRASVEEEFAFDTVLETMRRDLEA